MIRREFMKSAAMAGAGALTPLGQSPPTPQVAVTIDDFNLFGESEPVATKRNRALLETLQRHSNVKAAIFVACGNVDSTLGRKLLGEWNDAGHIIGNHTYSHRRYASSNFDEYSKDVLRCDALLKDHSQFRKYFRFPTLNEGDTAENRDFMRAFLKQQNYRMGYVTIDNSDWYIDTRLRERIKTSPGSDTLVYRNYYLDHIWDRTTYYDKLAHDVVTDEAACPGDKNGV
jgi:peptidoglycan/xylan/chitin deacetylase (PgdA/CDA1 family)